MSKKHLLALSATLALGAGLSSVQAQTVFSGAVSSDPTLQANYSNGTAPTFGGTVTGGGTFTIKNAGNNDFVYSSGLGTTVFNNYIYSSGTNNTGGLGTFDITGGAVSFGASQGGSGSQNVFADGILNASGGTISFLNGNTSDSSSLWLGNSGGAATVNVTGGTVITQNGLLVDRDGSTSGTVNVSSGLFNVEGATGTTLNANGTINLSGGTFEESASDALTFSASSFINFSTGSTGTLSLFDASTSYLDGLVTNGDIYKNGAVDTTLSDFAIAGSTTGQGTLALAGGATVPEPSTWALLLGSLAVTLVIQRKRFVQS